MEVKFTEYFQLIVSFSCYSAPKKKICWICSNIPVVEFFYFSSFAFVFSALCPEATTFFVELMQSKLIGEAQLMLLKIIKQGCTSYSHVLHSGARQLIEKAPHAEQQSFIHQNNKTLFLPPKLVYKALYSTHGHKRAYI